MRDKERKREYDRQYHAARKELRNQRRREDPDKHRCKELEAKYGITSSDYRALLAKQDGKCAICFKDSPGCNRDHFCVDHCHRTGHVRGLLCHKCNLGLGHLMDSRQLLVSAIAYLDRPPASHDELRKPIPESHGYQAPVDANPGLQGDP